jgi:hypothetical protein
MKANNLLHGLEVLRGSRNQLLLALIPQTCVVFRSSDTKDALSSLKKILLLFIFYGQRGREAGAFLVRKTKPARGLHQRQLINGERIGKDRSFPPLDSTSN